LRGAATGGAAHPKPAGSTDGTHRATQVREVLCSPWAIE
jgi:hypothetical protein